MTKEELEKEAYLFAKNSKDVQNFECGFDIAFKSYLAGAEPREKHIEELEKENKTMRSEIGIAKGYIERIEKENAEQKEKLGDVQMQKAGGKSDLVWKLKTANEQKAEQLAKAKEIIKKLLSRLNRLTYTGLNCEECKEAEQFLKEEADDKDHD